MCLALTFLCLSSISIPYEKDRNVVSLEGGGVAVVTSRDNRSSVVRIDAQGKVTRSEVPGYVIGSSESGGLTTLNIELLDSTDNGPVYLEWRDIFGSLFQEFGIRVHSTPEFKTAIQGQNNKYCTIHKRFLRDGVAVSPSGFYVAGWLNQGAGIASNKLGIYDLKSHQESVLNLNKYAKDL